MADSLWTCVREIHFRGKRRLLERWGPRAGVRPARLHGAQFELDLSDSVQRRMFFGTHEPRECRAVRARLRPGMTVIDAGANAGLYTALAAACVGARGRVIAYEPQPQVCARLRAMVEGNALPGVEVVEAALSAEAGRQWLAGDTLTAGPRAAGVWRQLGEATSSAGLPCRKSKPGHRASVCSRCEQHGSDPGKRWPCHWVTTRTLDGEAQRLGLDFIDLLKLDLEGHEPQALLGARQLLAAGRIGALLCEFREPELRAAGWSCAALEAMVEQAGFVSAAGLPRTGENRFFRLNSGQQL